MPRPASPAPSSSSASGKKESVPFTPAPANFVAAFYEHLLPADLALFTAQERARIASSIWALASSRKRGEVKLRVFNPSPERDGWTVDHTVIEIINDDMPFLVDSVTGVLQRRGLAVHMVIHPVLRINRDGAGHALSSPPAKPEDAPAESFMHIQIDHSLEPAQLKEIEEEVRATLRDVRIAVEDWPRMRSRMQEVSDQITASSHHKDAAEDIDEVRAFLRWLSEDNFTFLGYREIDLKQSGDDVTSIRVVPGQGLGILRDDEARMFGGLRDFDKRKNPALRKYVRQHHVLFVTKTNAITRVHRAIPMDAVFVRRFSAEGAVVSEKLFVGLFTSKTYAQTPRDIPFMRRKIGDVVARMGFAPKSHDGRHLMHILNTYPHDELFQISEEDLYANARGILQLQERARVALFVRQDPFGRYVTCLVYVPRDRYDSKLRSRIQDFLEVAYQGKAQPWNVRIDDSRLARAFVTISLSPDSPRPDSAQLESALRELCRTWAGRLRDSLVEAYGEASALVLLRRYGEAFPETYCETVPPPRAVTDIRNLERVRQHPHFIADLFDIGDGRLRLKLFQPGKPLSLSETLPLIENMGLKIDYMGGPYEITFKDESAPIYIHEFVGRSAQPSLVAFDHVKIAFEEALAKIVAGEVESDSFNALTLRIGMGWSGIVVLRALARYLRQLRIPYSHEMIAAVMKTHPQVAQQLYALFYARHNPELKGDRAAEMRALENVIAGALAKIDALEDDRIIRRYLNLVQSSLRTNYFQTDEAGRGKNYLSIKFDSRAVDFMPLPKPLVEIFVYSMMTEAVHLRGGKVARGGIRWSDRRDDFRNEILGLMKAQMVKNSVIVPVGSKGGFIVKNPSPEPEKFAAEGIACYKVMMAGLFDITDNSKNGRIVPPPQVVRHDGDDPYLVVAADKGTAKFSDTANAISQSYGFWLDDAFASGGSAGYDHKEMGITARGAWEAVKRHFRELGKDIQNVDFTCIGVGDMSGDVFGNGMLLSKHTLLLGAFDHRHIFCDPAPDAAKSFAERRRLYNLTRSSWNDYDRKLISKGGGVFARGEKSIKISPEMKKAYGINAETLAPAELMQAMLKADVELMYFGGIGTYVKATDESHDDAGDRANDAVRISGAELRAKVVGEGANLAMTQHGRVEYAKNGGHLNTDAIDNSAGVDTSDHEVNIKILLRKAVDKKALTIEARNKLLASMTEEVGHLVLRDNYLQTEALSVAEARASDLLPAHVRCIQLLEKTGLLNRGVEFLPDDAEISSRQKVGKGLTRPELAVLLAYTKLWLFQKLIDSDLPDDPALQEDLASYFPQALRKNYARDIAQHQLKREIVATVVTNDIVNHTGPQTVLMLGERTGAAPDLIVRAYLLARASFDLPGIWAGIDALDNKVKAATQTRMMVTVKTALAGAMERLLAEPQNLQNLSASIAVNHKRLEQLGEWLGQNATILTAIGAHHAEADWRAQGVPADIARRVAVFPVIAGALDLVALAVKTGMGMGDLAALYFGLEKRLGIGWLAHLGAAQTPWQREAAGAALDELAEHHRRLTAQLAAKKTKGKQKDMAEWEERNAAKLEPYDALLAEGRAAGNADLAMLLLANKRLSGLPA
ncbi:MAG: NAD-glutamate dehydrogenase [Alphaproteobacteria bacterium]|nr:NAD-glutamate dehydrogenase [Alphaproteobacteria bacterium]